MSQFLSSLFMLRTLQGRNPLTGQKPLAPQEDQPEPEGKKPVAGEVQDTDQAGVEGNKRGYRHPDRVWYMDELNNFDTPDGEKKDSGRSR